MGGHLPVLLALGLCVLAFVLDFRKFTLRQTMASNKFKVYGVLGNVFLPEICETEDVTISDVHKLLNSCNKNEARIWEEGREQRLLAEPSINLMQLQVLSVGFDTKEDQDYRSDSDSLETLDVSWKALPTAAHRLKAPHCRTLNVIGFRGLHRSGHSELRRAQLGAFIRIVSGMKNLTTLGIEFDNCDGYHHDEEDRRNVAAKMIESVLTDPEWLLLKLENVRLQGVDSAQFFCHVLERLASKFEESSPLLKDVEMIMKSIVYRLRWSIIDSDVQSLENPLSARRSHFKLCKFKKSEFERRVFLGHAVDERVGDSGPIDANGSTVRWVEWRVDLRRSSKEENLRFLRRMRKYVEGCLKVDLPDARTGGGDIVSDGTSAKVALPNVRILELDLSSCSEGREDIDFINRLTFGNRLEVRLWTDYDSDEYVRSLLAKIINSHDDLRTARLYCGRWERTLRPELGGSDRYIEPAEEMALLCPDATFVSYNKFRSWEGQVGVDWNYTTHRTVYHFGIKQIYSIVKITEVSEMTEVSRPSPFTKRERN